MRIDHVIYATADLEAAAARVEAEIGVAAVAGGRHDRIGTHNRDRPARRRLSRAARGVRPEPRRRARRSARPSSGGSPSTATACSRGRSWSTTSRRSRERLDTEVTAISRKGLTARLTGVAEAMRDPTLPFFIARDHGVRDPSEGDGRGRDRVGRGRRRRRAPRSGSAAPTCPCGSPTAGGRGVRGRGRRPAKIAGRSGAPGRSARPTRTLRRDPPRPRHASLAEPSAGIGTNGRARAGRRPRGDYRPGYIRVT